MKTSIGAVYLLTYLDSQTGGMERQALQLAKKLRDQGHEIFFITCAHVAKMRKEHLRLVDTKVGFKVYRIPLIGGARYLNLVLYGLGALTLLVYTRRQYQLIHAHQLHVSGIVACLAKAWIPSKKVIIKNAAGGEPGDVASLRRFPWHNRIVAWMNKYADYFIGVSEQTMREMESIGLRPLRLIPNAVNTTHFVGLDSLARVRIKKELLGRDCDGKKIVLFVGRLGPEKNLFTLLDAIVLAENDTILLIVGDGKLRKQLEVYAIEKGMKDRVIFYGSVDDTKPFYEIADVFVLPSFSEGLPNVLLEAMSCVAPSIGSNIAGIRAVITPGFNGYLFEKDNPRQLAHFIMKIINDPGEARRVALNGREIVEERFSIDSVVQKYATLYGSL